MADNRNFAALDWLIHEIGESLKEARQALESYVENPKDTVRISFCLTHIHQVHGSLQMVEFFGAALLADEMEQLTQAMIHNKVDKPDEAQEVLMRAILQFPLYLEQVKVTRKDNPLVVLPLLNDLRAVRGESLLTDTKLFVPNLTLAKKISGARSTATKDDAQFKLMLLKLRQMYQYAAAGYIRAYNCDENLHYLEKVFSRLQKLTQGTARHALWDICLALVEALELDAIETSAAVKNLLRQLDKEIKVLAVHGKKALNTFTNDELIKNLLYYVARAGKNVPGFAAESNLQRIFEAYALDAALVEGKETSGEGGNNNMLSAPDSDAMRSVVVALKSELDVVKEALDVCLSGGDVKTVFNEALPVVKRIADTMAVLGLGDLRKQILEQGAALELMANSDSSMSHDQLLSVAGNIIAIEDALDSVAQHAGSAQYKTPTDEASVTLSRAKESVIRESRNGLEHAKDAIIEYIASQWDCSHLQAVPQMLREIRGGLEILPLPRAAKILSACARYIEEQLLTQEITPQWAALDSLADAITGVEYYLERLSGGSTTEENDLLLSVAEDSMGALGYAVAKTPRVDATPMLNPAPVVSSALVITTTPEAALADEENLAAAYESALQISESIELSLPLESVTPDEELLAADPAPIEETLEVDQASSVFSEEKADEVAINTSSGSEVVNASSSEDSVVTAEIPEDIDAEIIEIFVEEAGEVLETIAEYFPRWVENQADEEALVEFRRAFHTLKGSGRMVGAHDIGELAWSIENMLNRILDKTIQTGEPHCLIIEKTRLLFPAMVEAFSRYQPNPSPALSREYQAIAESLAKGIVPDSVHLTAVVQLDESTSELEVPVLDSPAGEMEAASSHLENTQSLAVDTLVESQALASLSDDDFDDDAQLWEIFGAEALTHLTVVEDFIAHMDAEAPCFEVPTDSVQRALHTLKGSAHMADIKPIAALATPLEKFIKDLRGYHVVINQDILELLRDGVSYTHKALAQIEQGEPVEIPRLQQFLARVNELQEIHIAPLVQQQDLDNKLKPAVDPELLAVFMAEEMNLLLDADKVIAQWSTDPSNSQLMAPVLAELIKLNRAAHHAYLPPMYELGEQIQQVYERILAEDIAYSTDLDTDLNAAHIALLDMVDAIAAGQTLTAAPAIIQRSLDALLHTSNLPLLDLIEEDVVEDDIPVLEITEIADEEDTASIALPLEPELNAKEDIHKLTELSEFDEALQFTLADESEDLPLLEVEDEYAEVASELDAEETAPNVDVELPEDFAVATEELSPVVAVVQNTSPRAEMPFNNLPFSVDSARLTDSADDDYDEEIVEIFLEEAQELLEEMEHALHDWQDDWSNDNCNEELKRCLHTFKGGARLAGLTHLGDLSHDYETFIIDRENNNIELDTNIFRQLNTFQDSLHAAVLAVTQGVVPVVLAAPVLVAPEVVPPVVVEPLASIDNSMSQAEAAWPKAVPSPNAGNSTHKPNILTFAPKPKPVAAPLPQIPGSEFGSGRQGGGGQVQHLATRRAGPQEVVKVSAELLEELVNLAGETSISRGRMEQQVTDLGGSIAEMDATIHRLQEQLRRLDIETEAQVLFRQEQMAQHEQFDPLEMDRYSQLQQLSRSLIESASDLMDLKYTLADKTRDTETLLLQQSRINTDLQEGLMRSRMVPFSRLVPRLRRIVRQAATELGKEVEFELDNVEGELDRTVLERMVAPLEHMLRNAVDHGIEMADERLAAGKPANGRISLSLSREGGDVMLRLSDDGRGINLKRVREKAIERGLMAVDAPLSDQDLMQFILHAGFSTADKVTQISGRGVGMDVVHSEIKQLGGGMVIDSQWGEGTDFIIRLPFTVSVNRALMVQIGDNLYAIPLNTIEGIVRVSPFELEHYYQDVDGRFEYAGERYLVRYLGALLDTSASPKLEGQSLPLPVILVRSAENTVALQVDRLLGSREIVVKTLGVQFGSVRGISGATVTGDGSVVVILDLHALIRQQLAQGLNTVGLLSQSAAVVEEAVVEKLIMVVDDSVTVRKVTSRFLEREGFRVITAKDGVEALQLLQDHMPDVMLLDIEMPRMDGFEVAKNIRGTSRLRHIPIIMITSRTGEKHREHALELGVNKYMGKPYQEDLLLGNIQELMTEPVK